MIGQVGLPRRESPIDGAPSTMRDGEGERVGGVARGRPVERQESANHARDLHLVGVALAGDRLLDLRRCVLRNFHAGSREPEEHDPAGMPELRGRLDVAMEKERFHRPDARRVADEDLA